MINFFDYFYQGYKNLPEAKNKVDLSFTLSSLWLTVKICRYKIAFCGFGNIYGYDNMISITG